MNPSLPDSKPWFYHIPRSLPLQAQDLCASEKSGGSESKAPCILRLVFSLKIPMNSVCFLMTKLTFKKLLLSWFELIAIRKGLYMCNLIQQVFNNSDLPRLPWFLMLLTRGHTPLQRMLWRLRSQRLHRQPHHLLSTLQGCTLGQYHAWPWSSRASEDW